MKNLKQTEEGRSTNQLLERHRRDFHNEESRYAAAETFLNAYVSAQIKTLREDQELSQEELAVMIGTKQSGISRLENANYSAWKVETLRKIAKALGVRLVISFEGFGTLWKDIANFNRKSLQRPRFENDRTFGPVAKRKGQDTAEFGRATGSPLRVTRDDGNARFTRSEPKGIEVQTSDPPDTEVRRLKQVING